MDFLGAYFWLLDSHEARARQVRQLMSKNEALASAAMAAMDTASKRQSKFERTATGGVFARIWSMPTLSAATGKSPHAENAFWWQWQSWSWRQRPASWSPHLLALINRIDHPPNKNNKYDINSKTLLRRPRKSTMPSKNTQKQREYRSKKDFLKPLLHCFTVWYRPLVPSLRFRIHFTSWSSTIHLPSTFQR